MSDYTSEFIWLSGPPPGGLKIRHVGVINLGNFYRWLNRFMSFYGLFKKNTDFEEWYMEETQGPGKKIEIKWHGKHDANKYFTYHIHIMWLLIAVTDIEAEKNGIKIKLQKGDYELRLAAGVEKKIPKSIFKRIYHFFIINKTIEDHKDKVYDFLYTLHGEITKQLKQPI